MRKIKLNMDALRVDTFEPGTGEGAEAGTVHARATGGCPANTDYHDYSCNIASCGGTCIITYIPCGTCGDSASVDIC